MLKVDALTAGYGSSQVLFGMGFEAHAGQVVSLVGRNGMARPRRSAPSWGCCLPVRAASRWTVFP